MITIPNLILASLYYFVPAYFANGAPVLLKRFNPLKMPVDFNKKFKGQPIFGSHKTWGGLIIASLIGLLTFYVQKLLYLCPFFQKYSLFDYSEQTVWLGFLLGFGAIFGDLIKSFFKRRFHHKPGSSWIPFDKLDFVLVAYGKLQCQCRRRGSHDSFNRKPNGLRGSRRRIAEEHDAKGDRSRTSRVARPAGPAVKRADCFASIWILHDPLLASVPATPG